MKEIERKLLKIKEEIERSRTTLARKEGVLQELKKSLKSFGCYTVKEAEEKLAGMKEEIEELEEQIKQETEELLEKYGQRESDEY